MNIPDENLEDYVARMAVVMNRDIRLPQATRKTHASERQAEDQAQASSSERCKVDSESNITAPERPSHEGTSVLKRREIEPNSTDAPVPKKHKQVHTTANSNAAGEQTTFESIDIAHNPASPGPVQIRSKPPTATTKRSTDDDQDPSSSAFVECATSAHNSPHAPAMYSSNQGLRHSQLDAVPIPSPGASKPPPSIMNDQMGQSNPKLHVPRTNLLHRRSKANATPQASSISPQELLSRPTYKTPNHTDGNKHRQPISTTPANVFPASDAAAIQPSQASSITPLTLNPSKVTSSSHSEAPTTKHMRDNVDSSLVKSQSIDKSGRPTQGPSSATSISEFLPQATSTQLPATPAGPVSKVANFSRSKVTPKRDRVLKLPPKHKAETDISNITTPNATEVSISTAPDAGVSSSVLPKAGASNTKPVVAKDKKLAASKSKKKEKELVTPLAYARILCNKLDVLAKKTDFLKGKRLFYTGGDMQYASQSTKKKMELVRSSSSNLNPHIPHTYLYDHSHFDLGTHHTNDIRPLDRSSNTAGFLFPTLIPNTSHIS
ncbi:hypothetical protein PILCRDRAFT_820876 [Piloderma croceum F 1598]|uniref:Uncharacterized protein n=1 Tax=Piloderma croceum (strain F 1598) TaxID=765440 RepID=A0A0C3BX35_PILCF|nr:hypothetical protein PILCRDRAFT_820876 [Piloderma croceum F 1598]